MRQRTLYRPVGLFEWRLIQGAECRAFPPRLPDQPIFYPVLNEAYAAEIAKDWNTVDPLSGFVGLVTAFKIDEMYASKFQVHTVGGRQHAELWVSAAELDIFNRHILSPIRVTQAFYGEQFKGERLNLEGVLHE